MNDQPLPPPSAQCAEFAPLLPVLDEPGLDPRQVAEARQHLRTCAYCQAQLRLDAAIASDLRRRFAATSTYSTEDIMQSLFKRDRAASSAADQIAPSASSAPIASPVPQKNPARPPSRVRSVFSGVVAVVVVVGLIAFAQILFRAGTPGAGNGPRGPLVVSLPGTKGWFSDISMVSPTNGWAIGFVSKTAKGKVPAQTVALYHYNGTTWTPTFVPVGIPTTGNVLMEGSISMDSATDGWAAGSNDRPDNNGYGSNFVLHYTGGAWHLVPTPITNDIQRIQALGPKSVWVVNAFIGSPPQHVYHFDGTTWQSDDPISDIGRTNQSGGIASMQMLSANEGWIAATVNDAAHRDGGLAFIHYLNGAWSLSGSIFTNVDAAGLRMSSVNDGWAIGNEIAPIDGNTYRVPYKQLIYHYTNGQWQPAAVPLNQSDDVMLGGSATNLYGAVHPIALPNASEGWMSGFTHSTLTGETIDSISQNIMLLHLVNGQWQHATVPTTNATNDGINSFAFASTDDGWAVGYETGGTVSSDAELSELQPLLLHYQNGAWSVYQQG